jgi:hypothetical protein
VDLVLEQAPARVSPRVTALLGATSFLLLIASFMWAHHWGPVADSLVAAWAVTTLASLRYGRKIRRAYAKRDSDGVRVGQFRAAQRRLANVALAFASVSVVALVLAGAAFALGGDPAGACGGG